MQCEDPNSTIGRVCTAMMKGLGKAEKVDADASGAAATPPADTTKPAAPKP